MKKDMGKVWIQYKEKNDIEARDDLIIHYAHLVKYVAHRLAINLSSVVEVDELISYGIEGLIDAIGKFDYKRKVKFETYALTRIRGAMIDGLRAMDWVPVSVRQKSKNLEKVFTSLESKLGRAATDMEVAEEMGISINELSNFLREVSANTIISLDDFIQGDDNNDKKKRIVDLLQDNSTSDALALIEIAEVKELLSRSISRLPDKEKKVVSLYYYEGLTLKEIGVVLGLSESRISQLHTKAILRLRGSLSKKKNQVL